MKNTLNHCPIIPVITIHKEADALPIAEALFLAGINTLEIVLRTPASLTSLQKITENMPECIVGAGTITNANQLHQAVNTGAQFIVSPGITPELCKTAQSIDIPYLPGVATPSEMLIATDHKIDTVKLFPANLVGGTKALKTYASLFPNLSFCPTGGITADNAQDYLSLSNVIAIGGSWLAPQALIEAKDWGAITELARQALSLVK